MHFLICLALTTALTGAAAKAVPAPEDPVPSPTITPPPKPIKFRPAFKRDLRPRATGCDNPCGSLFCCLSSEACIDSATVPYCVDSGSADLLNSALGLSLTSYDTDYLNSLTNTAYLYSLLGSYATSSVDYLSLLSALPSNDGYYNSYLSLINSYTKTAKQTAAAAATGTGTSDTILDFSSSSPTTTTSTKKKTPIGAIVGGVVGGLAVLAIIGAIIFFVRRKRNKSKVVHLPPGHIPGAGVKPPPAGVGAYQPPVAPTPVQQEKPPASYYNPAPVPGTVELGMNTQKAPTPAPQQTQQWTGSTQYSAGSPPPPPPPPPMHPPVEMHGQSSWVPPPDGRTQPVEMYGGETR